MASISSAEISEWMALAKIDAEAAREAQEEADLARMQVQAMAELRARRR